VTNERKEEIKMLLDEHFDKIGAIIPTFKETLKEILKNAPTEHEIKEVNEGRLVDLYAELHCLYAEITNVVDEYNDVKEYKDKK